MKKVKYSILVTDRVNELSSIIEALYKVSDNIYISSCIEDSIDFMTLKENELIVIDGQKKLQLSDLERVREFERETIFIDQIEGVENLDSYGRVAQLSQIDEEYLRLLIKLDTDVENEDLSVKRKSPKLFRDVDSFKASITKEVRRAKRYHYPLVVVMIQIEEKKYLDDIIAFFSSKIREFDSLYISDSNHFSMTLPHTGWYGAEVLTTRLIKDISARLNIDIDSIRNLIRTFKRSDTDVEFIETILNSVDSEYYPISKDIDFEVWRDEFFSEFSSGKVVRLYNQYKGMVISHDVDISLEDQSLKVRNLRSIQKGALELEKVTYFESSNLNKMIRAGVHNIDDKGIIELSSFEIVDSCGIKNRTLNFIVEESIDASFGNYKGKLFEVSLDKVEILFSDELTFNEGEKESVTIELPSQKGVDNLTMRGSVLSVETSSTETIVELFIETGERENRLISDYLSKKQMQFIAELKKFGK
jgi:hypothetical protein